MKVNRAALMRGIFLHKARSQGRAKMLTATNYTRSGNTASSKKAQSSTSTSQLSNLTSSEKTKKMYLYEEIQEAADALQGQATALIKIGLSSTQTEDEKTESTTSSTTTSETETAEAQQTEEEKKVALLEEEKTTVLSSIKKLVEQYNTIYENLGELTSNTNKIFRAQLKTAIKGEEKDLAKLGISLEKDGTLSIDDKTLKNASLEDLKATFCDSKGLVGSLRTYCEDIEADATSSLKVMNRLYGSSWNYNKYGTSSNTYNTSSGNWYSSIV